MTPQYFGNQGVATPWFPKCRGVAHLLIAKNSPVSKVLGSCDAGHKHI